MSRILKLPVILPAITLWPEWAWAVAWLDKRIENREWAASRSYWRTLIAIHAGTNIGGRGGKIARREGIEALIESAAMCGWHVEEDRERSYGDGSVGLRAARHDAKDGSLIEAPVVSRAIIAVAELVDCVWDNPEEGWGIGPCQWRLANVRRLPNPIGGVPGSQGIWMLPSHVRAQVADELEASAA